MSRFGEKQDPLFRRINSLISFDWRLASFDVEQSKAHARALVKLGVLDEGELRQIVEGLDRVGGELEQGSFEFNEHDEDIHMAIERRLTDLSVCSAASCTRHARATTRSQPTFRCWSELTPRER